MNLKYIIYARKSIESEDRQVQSIDDQLNRLRDIAATRSLQVIDVLTEARSAKSPYSRPVFDTLLSRIEKGQADGILCWQINRLSRNPIDSGRLAWMLQKGMIKSIHTVEREYRPEDNILLLAVETGIANQFIIDLARNVKRGMLGKAQRGEWPSRAPSGYLNDKYRKVIVKDHARFELLKGAWDLMLTGNYSVARVLSILNDHSGFRTAVRGKVGGGPLSLSALHDIFSNPFYAGIIEMGGQRFPGKHDAMVTIAEFEQVQKLLHRPNRPRPSKLVFSYSRLLRCGECGCLVTAEAKIKTLSNGKRHSYTYYHCTLRSKRRKCQQRSYIREEELTTAFGEQLKGVAIGKSFSDFAVRQIERALESRKRRPASRDAVEADHRDLNTQKDRLLDAFMSGLISKDRFEVRQRELEGGAVIRQLAERQSNDETQMKEKVKQVLLHLTEVDEHFASGTMQLKRDIISRIGSNRLLLNGKLSISFMGWCKVLRRAEEDWKSHSVGFEPDKGPKNAEEKHAMSRSDSAWWSLVEKVHNLLPKIDEQRRHFLWIQRGRKKRRQFPPGRMYQFNAESLPRGK